jgi:beta-glucanase (GH16 family)
MRTGFRSCLNNPGVRPRGRHPNPPVMDTLLTPHSRTSFPCARIAILIRLATVLLLSAAAAATASAQLIWSEEFDIGTAPNPNVWSYDLGAGGWGNAELQSYTSDSANVRVEGGYLRITAREQLLKGGRRSFTSARIKTQDKFTFKYGTIEARILVPNLANGLWPAFWTLGNNFSTVGWPHCGEIDIMEMGSAAAISAGLVNRRVGSAAHWEYNGGHAEYGLSYDSPTNLNGTWRVYRMEWTPTMISTYIDNTWIWSIDISNPASFSGEEFHHPHFLILNLAVGGSYTGITLAQNITAPFPAEMLVDYIRIYDNGFTVLGGSSIGGSATTAHVQSITPGITGGGPNKKATASVLVHNNLGVPVSGATVTGTFSGSHNQTVTATTNSSGIATLTTSVTSNAPSFTICVNSVSHATLTYNSAANVETCDNY